MTMSRGSDSVPRMTQIDRRRLLALGAASLALPAAIERAWAIEAKSVTGTIQDVEHVVILMQENRSFDHYFGTMSGVRASDGSRRYALTRSRPSASGITRS